MGNEKLEIRNEKLEVELAAWLEYESFAVRAKAVNGKIFIYSYYIMFFSICNLFLQKNLTRTKFHRIILVMKTILA